MNFPDPDVCVHGWPHKAERPCFFCNYRSRTVAEVIAAEPVIPEHRNPPATETRQTFSISSQRGGAATKQRKAAQRGNGQGLPSAIRAERPEGGQCTGTTLEGKRCQRHAEDGRFCLHHDPERAPERERWRDAVRQGGGRAGAAPAPKAACAPADPVTETSSGTTKPPPANRADIAGRKGGSAEHAYRPIPRALRRLQNLERQLDQMKETVRRCIADLVAARGEPQA